MNCKVCNKEVHEESKKCEECHKAYVNKFYGRRSTTAAWGEKKRLEGYKGKPYSIPNNLPMKPPGK